MFQHGYQEHATPADPETLDVGRIIIEHVSNTGLDHPLIHLPPIFGVDMSVTKHVLMLWIVASIVLLVVTWTVRRYLAQERLLPTGFMTALEAVVEFVRDNMVEPNVGRKWTHVWTPFVLTLFFFILVANGIGLVPLFELIGLFDRVFLHLPEEAFLNQLLHGGATATGNYNVTAGLATITFIAVIAAGTRAHGFIGHWRNLVPGGLAAPLYVLLIPIEILGMLVRPFALTMRLAANMTGGHIAILAMLSFVFLFAQLAGTAAAGIGVGLLFSVPLAVAITALEIIIVLVQAYVFALLSAVFLGMAIHAHH